MPELSGRELLHEWQKLMESVFASASSLAGRSELPRQLQDATERQLELLGEILERERGLQREVAALIVAPVDAIFDLLEQSGTALRRQAETVGAAGRALEETASLMRDQAELFTQTVGTLRQPHELARAAAGLERRPAKGEGRQSGD